MLFQSYNFKKFQKSSFFYHLPQEERLNLEILCNFFPLKINNYVVSNLINWSSAPNDPVYRLVFPRREMLPPEIFSVAKQNLNNSSPQSFLHKGIIKNFQKRGKIYPLAMPTLDGLPIKGLYRQFPTILSLYPLPAIRTCHSYCSYCFRWKLFKDSELQKGNSYVNPCTPVHYLKSNPEITDVLFTGADPLVAKSSNLQEFVNPILSINSIKVIRFSTKALAYWPFRFTRDKDADNLLYLFEQIISNGKHINISAHYSHYRELEHPEVEKAIKRIQGTGAVIRTQGPLVKDVNDSPEVWSKMWNRQIQLGMIPYYMFMEADHHPQSCFRVRPAEALRIFQEAQKVTTGLARTVRGPVFMYDLNRVLLDGTTTLNGQKYFVLKTLQSPPGTQSEGDIKLVPYDERAMDLGNLFELFNKP